MKDMTVETALKMQRHRLFFLNRPVQMPIHISHGIAIHSYYSESGFNIQNVKIVKDVVSVPVIGVGRMNDPALMLSALRTGAMDFVALGRESVCDPHLPEKIKEGRLDEILTCTGCMQRCLYPNSFEEGFGFPV